jgi:hypothetical protein
MSFNNPQDPYNQRWNSRASEAMRATAIGDFFTSENTSTVSAVGDFLRLVRNACIAGIRATVREVYTVITKLSEHWQGR